MKEVLEIEAYKIRASKYSEKYFKDNLEGHTSQEILCAFPRMPEVVKNSTIIKQGLCHLNKKQQSEIVTIDLLQETLGLLNTEKYKLGRDQKMILAASVTSPYFCVLKLGLHSWEEKQVEEIKFSILRGEQKVLTMPVKATRQVFPQGVKELATKH